MWKQGKGGFIALKQMPCLGFCMMILEEGLFLRTKLKKAKSSEATIFMRGGFKCRNRGIPGIGTGFYDSIFFIVCMFSLSPLFYSVTSRHHFHFFFCS